MTDWMRKLSIKVQFLKEECAQDLIEYALVALLIAFAAVVGMNTVANGINSAFSSISSKLTSATS